MIYTKRKLLSRIHSFMYAFNGLKIALKETNLKIQLLVALSTTILGLIIGFTKQTWIVIIICSGLVVGLEIVNTSIEHLCDFVHPNNHVEIKRVKDLGAAAVFVAAIASFLVAIILLTI